METPQKNLLIHLMERLYLTDQPNASLSKSSEKHYLDSTPFFMSVSGRIVRVAAIYLRRKTIIIIFFIFFLSSLNFIQKK